MGLKLLTNLLISCIFVCRDERSLVGVFSGPRCPVLAAVQRVNQGRIPALVRRYCYRRLPQGMSQEVQFLLSLLITKVALFSNGVAAVNKLERAQHGKDLIVVGRLAGGAMDVNPADDAVLV